MIEDEAVFIDIGTAQQKKNGQNAYGDFIASKRYPEECRLIAVLSDGLGSGIKANILANMTATMLLKFAAAERNLIRAAETVMNALPVCQVRKISYSTFSVADCFEDGTVRIVEEGNPEFLHLHNGKVVAHECERIASQKFPERSMRTYVLHLEKDDRLLFCSDGVTQSGLGGSLYKLGWRREGLIDFVESRLASDPVLSCRRLAQEVVGEALTKEPDRLAKDDISCMVLHLREPRSLVVFTGPPYDSNRDAEYVGLFMRYPGKKVICGGTTANVVARELNREITTERFVKGSLPAGSRMDGVDLITEGVLTLSKAVEYLEDDPAVLPDDAAGRLVGLFLDSDEITFMVGAKVNQAHFDPDLPLELELRKNIVRRMERLLTQKYVKQVLLRFI
ncbi:MAG: SpoIIE family protein phosphatase [Alphaproteobacteria bacterium]|nr:SpoIIE family protein phosphatase [Alphaproteobacteria bacterium]